MGEGFLPIEILKSYKPSEIFIIILKEARNIDFSLLQNFDFQVISFAKLGKIIREIKKRGITRVCMAGRVEKPLIRSLSPDLGALFVFFKILLRKVKGDDVILKAVIEHVEKKGIKVIGVKEILPSLVVEEGILTSGDISNYIRESISIGIKVLNAISPFDIGQAIVVQEGVVLGIEGVEGTDALIQRCGSLKYNSKNLPILIKAAKIGQTFKADMPAIGKQTIDILKEYGFGGVALQSGGTIIIERSECIKKANEYHLFIIGF